MDDLSDGQVLCALIIAAPWIQRTIQRTIQRIQKRRPSEQKFGSVSVKIRCDRCHGLILFQRSACPMLHTSSLEVQPEILPKALEQVGRVGLTSCQRKTSLCLEITSLFWHCISSCPSCPSCPSMYSDYSFGL